MNGVPKNMAHYTGTTGKNRRKKLKDRLRHLLPGTETHARVVLILEEYAVLYHLQHSEINK